MDSYIHQLPDHIANQIAAGEVIQRPASVVKELVENAVDADAAKIIVNIKDAGKTLIQVTDNGKGMSETDARMAFERHATSKISTAQDLFHLQTMGFRGEALASVAAIANVSLSTRLHANDLGTQIQISGSDVVLQEPVQCAAGSNFQVKNLFFNVPARRKFLKADTTEFKHLSDEFLRVALTKPNIQFELIHNGNVIYNLPAGSLKQRIVSAFGKNYNDKLIPIETNTTLGHIHGYIGKTEIARKSPGEQYFFVNNRYMRHPYFYKAVLMAYGNLLPKGMLPSFFIYFDVDPQSIDVNIHPTKTEIKFENEKPLWQIVMASVKESIGRHNLTPSIDFDTENSIHIPVASNQSEKARAPEIKVNPTYNPFDKDYSSQPSSQPRFKTRMPGENWENLYEGFNDDSSSETDRLERNRIDNSVAPDKIAQIRFFQIKEKYILSNVKSGLMLIDQKRAFERITFEQLKKNIDLKKSSTQSSLFPDEYSPNAFETSTLRDILEELHVLGFQIEEKNGAFFINGVPGELSHMQPTQLLEGLIANLDEANPDLHSGLVEMIASKLAQISSINKNKPMSHEEMEHLTENLLTCEMPNYTSDGKPIIRILSLEEIGKLLTN
jgi:DNA mismatch repair protein MutL